jgi:hypothetical protein
MKTLMEKRERLGLKANTFFLGNRKDIPQLTQSMDPVSTAFSP